MVFLTSFAICLGSLEYDTKGVQSILIHFLLELILKNAKIEILFHLPFYLVNVAHAMGSHTTLNKNCTTSMFDYLTQMASLELRFSIPHPTPSAAIRLKLNDLGFIREYHHMLVLKSPPLMAFNEIHH